MSERLQALRNEYPELYHIGDEEFLQFVSDSNDIHIDDLKQRLRYTPPTPEPVPEREREREEPGFFGKIADVHSKLSSLPTDAAVDAVPKIARRGAELLSATQEVAKEIATDIPKIAGAATNRLIVEGGRLLSGLGFDSVGPAMGAFGREHEKALLGNVSDLHKQADAGVHNLVAGGGDLIRRTGEAWKGKEVFEGEALAEVGRMIRKWGTEESKRIVESMTEQGQKDAGSLVFEDDPDSFTGYRLTDNWARSLYMNAAGSAATMLGSMIPGAIVTNTLQGLAKLGLTVTGAGGATIPLLAGVKKAETFAEKLVAYAPSSIGFGTGAGLVAAPMEASELGDEVREAKLDELRKSAVFRAMERDHGEEQAREMLAKQVEDTVFKNVFLATFGTSLLTAGGAEAMLFRFLATQGAKQILKQSLLEKGKTSLIKGAVKGATVEFAEETLQSGAEALIGNIAWRDYVDPSKDIWEGVGARALTGGAAGALLGAVGGGSAHIAGAGRGQEEEFLQEAAGLQEEVTRIRQERQRDARQEMLQDAAQRIDLERQRMGLDAIHKATSWEEARQAADRAVHVPTVTPEEVAYQDDLLRRTQEFTGTEVVPTVQPEATGVQPEVTGVQPEVAPSQVPSIVGAPVEIVMPDGTGMQAQWEVVSASALQASREVGTTQPRDRTRAASDLQIEGIAKSPDYRRLSDSPVMDVGAPTVDASGAIVGGNARFEALARAHQQGTATEYLNRMVADLKRKGIDPESVANIPDPVLIRRVTDPNFKPQDAAVKSNIGLGLQYSGLELARIDADRMQGLEDVEVTDKGEIALTAANREQIRNLFRGYEQTEMGALTDKDVGLSQDGVRRVRNAILYRAYGDSPALSRMVESTDNELRNVVRALARSSGPAMKAREAIRGGRAPKNLDITSDLVQAIEKLSQLKAQGQTVENYLRQQKIEPDGMSEASKVLLKFLSENMRSQVRMSQYLTEMYDAIAAVNIKARTLFDDEPAITKEEVIDRARETTRTQDADSGPSERSGQEQEPATDRAKRDTESERDASFSRTEEGNLNEQRGKQLERYLRRAGYDFTIETGVLRDVSFTGRRKADEFETAEKIARIFGRRIVPIKATGPFRINGVVVPSIKDTIFIDVSTDSAVNVVMGHELSHHMKHDVPEVYKAMVDAIEGVGVDIEAYAKAHGMDLDAEGRKDVLEEVVGDIMGDNFNNPDFWDRVAGYNPNAFRKIADTIISWLKKLVTLSKAKGLGSEQWVKDAVKAQDILAQAVAKYTHTNSSLDGLKNTPMFHRVWHGTSADFARFTIDKIGSGEGAQAYGHGLYFTDTKDIAEWYRDKLTKGDPLIPPRRYFRGEELKPGTSEYHAARLVDESDLKEAKRALSEFIKESEGWGSIRRADKGEQAALAGWKESLTFLGKATSKKDFTKKPAIGRLYEVELAPSQDEYLLWDKSLSDQSEKVRVALLNSPVFSEIKWKMTWDGKDIYQSIEDLLGGSKDVSDHLISIGIRGIKYLDGTSRAKGEGAFNYVIFDESDVEITAKFSRKTIEVDGVERPTDNSEGKPIHPTEEGVRNFWKWFADSKTVDEQGRPVIYYHGTGTDIIHFQPSTYLPAMFFSPSRTFAEPYARARKSREFGDKTGGNLMPVYIKAEKPFDPEDSKALRELQDYVEETNIIDSKGYISFQLQLESGIYVEDSDKLSTKFRELSRAASAFSTWQELERPYIQDAIMGLEHDSFFVKEGGVKNIGVYSPEQIKSAIGNLGTFDSETSDIRFSRRQGEGLTKAEVAGEYGADFKTGEPVTFHYIHNLESATELFGKPKKGDRFLRDKEPSGKYVTSVPKGAPAREGFETGIITFNNPLVIPNNNLKWKENLSSEFGGKTGKALSKAIISAGFDGVVTVDGGHTSEILDLTSFGEAKAKFSRRPGILDLGPIPGELNLDDAELRPGTAQEQKTLAKKVYKDFVGRVVNKMGGTLLGNAIARDVASVGGSSLIGKQVDNVNDLVAIAQVLRDPRWETFRVFFTKNNRIVHQSALSSRVPGFVRVYIAQEGESDIAAFARYLDGLKGQMEKAGADGYYLLHNHPSGRSKPSTADESITRDIAGNLPGFRGHVVINSGEYSIIGANGKSSTLPLPFDIEQRASEPSVDYNLLGNTITSPDELATFGKAVQNAGSDTVTIIGIGSKSSINAIATVPKSAISGDVKQARLLSYLRAFARHSGSATVSAVAPDKATFDILSEAVRKEVLLDVVTYDDADMRIRSAAERYGPGFGLFDVGKPRAMTVDEPKFSRSTFYSALKREIKGLNKLANKQGEIKGSQAALWIESRQKEGKFKKEEVEAVGVLDWLALRKDDKIPVSEIENFVEANGVQVADVMHGEDDVVSAGRMIESRYQEEVAQIADDANHDFWYDHIRMAAIDSDLDIDDLSNSEREELFYSSISSEDRIQAVEDQLGPDMRGAIEREINELVEFEDSVSDTPSLRTRFDKYQLPGGKDYRELALVLPGEKLFTAPRVHAMSPKGDANRLAHVRFNSRTTEDGKQTLFIEEIQSDWGQQGREQGFATKGEAELAKKLIANEDEADTVLSNIKAITNLRGDDLMVFVSVAKTKSASELLQREVWRNKIGNVTPDDIAEIDALVKRRVELLKEQDDLIAATPSAWYVAKNDGATLGAPYATRAEAMNAITDPDNQSVRRGTTIPGPFVTETKAWVNLAFKRMLRYAAENGFDAVAWTTGAQQAKRYSLSQVIDGIRYIDNKDGTYNVIPYKGADNVGEGKLIGAPIDKVSETYGKEVARMIRDGEGKKEYDNVNRRKITLKDTEIGGGGMKSFYDVIVPNVINSTLKKLKGPRVAQLEIEGLGKQPGFELTPELTDTAMEGLPLFSRRVTPAEDKAYAEAVSRGDMDTARQMVLDVAKRRGYEPMSEHRMQHQAPDRDNHSLATIRDSDVLPKDYWTHPHYYQSDDTEYASLRKIEKALNEQDQTGDEVHLIMYRAVPKSVKDSTFRNGDWITPSETYARQEGKQIPGGYKLISERVPLKHIRWDGNSIAEMGFDDGEDYAYRDTKHNRKLLDPATYYPSGALIPLSQRFDYKQELPLFSRQQRMDAAGVQRALPARESIVPPEGTSSRVRRTWQDKMRRWKDVGEWIEKEQGVDLQEAADVYTKENLSKGITANKIEDFNRETLEPLLKDVAGAKLDIGDIVTYLEALHIPEANERMRKLHGDPNATASGITDEQAQRVVTDFENSPEFGKLQPLAMRVRAIAEETLQMQLDAGLISQERYDNYRGAYKQWVPLRGNRTSEGFGKGLSTRDVGKRRKGHEMREDEFILENIIADRENTIRRIENNKVSMSVLEFLMRANHPDIGTVSRPEKKTSVKDHSFAVKYADRVMASFETRAAAEKAVARVMSGSNQAVMTNKEMGFDPSLLSIEQVYDPHLVMSASPMLAENEIVALVNGHEIRMQLTDPLLAQAATNGGIEQVGSLIEAGRGFNRFLSKMYTQYSPDFVLTNMARDAYSGLFVLTGRGGVGFTAKAAANYFPAMKELAKAINDPTKSDWVTRYRKAGGNIGAAYISDLERIGDGARGSLEKFIGARETYNRVFAEQKEAGASDAKARRIATLRAGSAGVRALPVLGNMFEGISRINAVVENTLRLAAFQTAIEEGWSEQDAARLSKDLLNFNRSGEKANTMGALWLFYNAGAQGADIVHEALFESKHKNQVWALVGGLTALSFLLAELGRGGDEDDEREWDNIPDHIKYRNLVLKFGDQQMTVPVAYGWGVFHAFGQVVSDVIHDKEDIYKASIKMADAFMENFSVMGNPIVEKEGEYGLNMLLMAPTLGKIVYASGANVDSFGNPIMPHKWSEAVPDSQTMTKAMRGTLYHQLAEALNTGTGGNKYEPGFIDVSPNTLKYMVTSFTGGAGRFVSDSITGAVDVASGITPEVESIPIIRRFVREQGVKDSRGAFWDAKHEVTKAASRFNKAVNDGDFDYADKKFEEAGDLIELSKYVNQSTKFANQIRDEILEIQTDENLSRKEKATKIRALEKEEKEVYDEFLKVFDKSKK